MVTTIALDAFFINWIVLTIYFKELPRWGEWLATTRLKRMARGSNQKQSRKADIFCSYLLDYFEPTEDHC